MQEEGNQSPSSPKTEDANDEIAMLRGVTDPAPLTSHPTLPVGRCSGLALRNGHPWPWPRPPSQRGQRQVSADSPVSWTQARAERGDRTACGPPRGAVASPPLSLCEAAAGRSASVCRQRRGPCQAPPGGARGRLSVTGRPLSSPGLLLRPIRKPCFFPLRAKQKGERSSGCWEAAAGAGSPRQVWVKVLSPNPERLCCRSALRREGRALDERTQQNHHRGSLPLGFGTPRTRVLGMPGPARHPPWPWPSLWPWDCTDLLSGSRGQGFNMTILHHPQSTRPPISGGMRTRTWAPTN